MSPAYLGPLPYPRGNIVAGASAWVPGLGSGELTLPNNFVVYSGPTHGPMEYVDTVTPMRPGDILVARVLYPTSYTTNAGTYAVDLSGLSDGSGNGWSLAFSLGDGVWQLDTYWTIIGTPLASGAVDYVELSWSGAWPQGLIFPEIPPLVTPPFNWASPESMGITGWAEWDARFLGPLDAEVWSGGFSSPGLAGIDPSGGWAGGGGAFGALGLTWEGQFQGVIWSALVADAAVTGGGSTYLPLAWTPVVPFGGTDNVRNSRSLTGTSLVEAYASTTVIDSASITGGFLYEVTAAPAAGGPIHLDDVHYRAYGTDDTELVP